MCQPAKSQETLEIAVQLARSVAHRRKVHAQKKEIENLYLITRSPENCLNQPGTRSHLRERMGSHNSSSALKLPPPHQES